jgi:hypothetical protein
VAKPKESTVEQPSKEALAEALDRLLGLVEEAVKAERTEALYVIRAKLRNARTLLERA